MVTVLFADLVESTGLAQRIDAERAREVLGRFYDATTQELLNLRGRPEKFIGDAVMAVFGLQQVHEDDALRAVRAGLAIRARARRLRAELRLADELEVRVGIESGVGGHRRGPLRGAPRDGIGGERGGEAADGGEAGRGAGRHHGPGAHRDGGLLRRAPGDRRQGIRCAPGGPSRRGSDHPIGATHDPVRRSCRRADAAARGLPPGGHEPATVADDDHRGARIGQVTPRRRARGGTRPRRRGAARARAGGSRQRQLRSRRGDRAPPGGHRRGRSSGAIDRAPARSGRGVR